jgi:cytoskeletal protein RodZ
MEKSGFKTPNNGGSAGQRPTLSASATHSSRKSSRKSGKKIFMWIVILLLLAGVIGGGVLAYKKYQDVKKENENLTSNPQEAVKKEQENLIKSVGALTDLPSGETPTIATVSDASKLKSQTFFANAENGDRVLIYTNAKKAYLYRPSTNKVINIAPVNIGNNNESTNTESNQ